MTMKTNSVRKKVVGKRVPKKMALLGRSSKRGIAVMYNPLAHAEFVTGFRKRKNARRLQAQAKAAEAEREKLRIARKEKREFIRETVTRMRVPSAEDVESFESTRTAEQTYALDDEEDTVIITTVSKMNASVQKDLVSIKSTLKVSKREYSRSKPLSKDIAATKNPRRMADGGYVVLKGARKSRVGKKRRARNTSQ